VIVALLAGARCSQKQKHSHEQINFQILAKTTAKQRQREGTTEQQNRKLAEEKRTIRIMLLRPCGK